VEAKPVWGVWVRALGVGDRGGGGGGGGGDGPLVEACPSSRAFGGLRNVIGIVNWVAVLSLFITDLGAADYIVRCYMGLSREMGCIFSVIVGYVRCFCKD